MERRNRSNAGLVAGLWVSLAVHVLVAMGFVRYSDMRQLGSAATESARKSPPQHKEPPQPETRQPVKLGISRSDAQTMTWLGYETPTEHSARLASLEQSAMTIADPGPPGVAGTLAPPAAEPAPPEQASRESVEQAWRDALRDGAAGVASGLDAARRRLADVGSRLARLDPVPPAPTKPV